MNMNESARAKNSGAARFVTQQMESAFDTSLDRTALNIVRHLSGQQDSTKQILGDLVLMEKLLHAGSASESSTRSVIEKQATTQTANISHSTTRVDSESVMADVHRAQRNRIDRLEHETMSKLVNKMRAREELDATVGGISDSISRMHADTDLLSQSAEDKRVAIARLQEMIAIAQASFEQDPNPEALPPLEEVDPSILNLV